MKKKTNLSLALIYFVLICGSVVMVFPFVWMVLTSFKTFKETMQLPIQWFPAQWNFDNYIEVLGKLDFARYYWNTILIVGIKMFLLTFISTLAGYAFAKMEFPGKEFIFGILLIVVMVPSQMTMIPKYQLIAKLGWVDTRIGIIVPGMFSVYTMFMMRQFYKAIPAEMDDAAKIDGCSHFKAYWMINLPLARNGLIAITVLNTLGEWNNLLWPMLVSQTDRIRTLAVAIATLNSRDGSRYNILTAASVMSILPMLILYAVFQKYFVDGITASGVKG